MSEYKPATTVAVNTTVELSSYLTSSHPDHRKIIIIAGGLAALTAALLSCTSSKPENKPVNDPIKNATPMPTGNIGDAVSITRMPAPTAAENNK